MAALRIIAGRSAVSHRDTGSLLGATLEVTERAGEAPARVDAAASLEAPLRDRLVAESAGDGFSAFLDGIQQTRVLGYLEGIIPVVHATVAAAIRERRDRVMHTWGTGPLIRRMILVPVSLIDTSITSALESDGFTVVDTAPGPEQAGHPLQFLAAARLAVQQRREGVEAELAAAWCAGGEGAIYVDGGIGGLPEAARRGPTASVVGVVKSHRTLYGDAQIAQTVAALRPGERTSAFSVATRRRTEVASWYLRLRDGAGDPLGGVVRVESAESPFTPARADELSSWILREREPVALPDSRWRVMAYGIADCEEYLRAVTA